MNSQVVSKYYIEVVLTSCKAKGSLRLPDDLSLKPVIGHFYHTFVYSFLYRKMTYEEEGCVKSYKHIMHYSRVVLTGKLPRVQL